MIRMQAVIKRSKRYRNLLTLFANTCSNSVTGWTKRDAIRQRVSCFYMLRYNSCNHDLAFLTLLHSGIGETASIGGTKGMGGHPFLGERVGGITFLCWEERKYAS
jgi:hypothetical protein